MKENLVDELTTQKNEQMNKIKKNKKNKETKQKKTKRKTQMVNTNERTSKQTKSLKIKVQCINLNTSTSIHVVGEDGRGMTGSHYSYYNVQKKFHY